MCDFRIAEAEGYFDHACGALQVNPDVARGKADVVALPCPYGDEYYYAQETIDFVKYCRERDSCETFDLLSDDEIQVRSLHSFDLWLPVIYIAQNFLLPTVVGLVANYIYERIKGHEQDRTKVEVSFLVEKEGESKLLSYSGDAEAFKEQFEKIDLNGL